MNASIFAIIFGAVLLFMPGGAWAGMAFMGIGLVAYYFTQSSPQYYGQAYPLAGIAPQRMRSSFQNPGVAVTPRTAVQSMDENPNQPFIDNGMFNLPVPIDGDVSRFVNVNYRTKTRAKGYAESMDKGGNPWLPGFDD